MGEMLRDNINFFALILLFISSILYIATLLINLWIQHKKEKTALLLGKRGSFKCEGKTLTGKVKYTCEDLCCVYVEVDGEDGLYVIKSKNFNPLDNKKGGAE
jgi:hypothetical protein